MYNISDCYILNYLLTYQFLFLNNDIYKNDDIFDIPELDISPVDGSSGLEVK